MIIKTYRA